MLFQISGDVKVLDSTETRQLIEDLEGLVGDDVEVVYSKNVLKVAGSLICGN